MADKQNSYTRMIEFENGMCRRGGVSRMERYKRNFAYYSGTNLPPDNVEQPLGVNYVKTINEKHNHYLWGQWDKYILNFLVKHPSGKEDETAQKIANYHYKVARTNDFNTKLTETGLNCSIYGDGILKPRWDIFQGRLAIESVLPEFVHFRWKASDMSELKEVIVSYPISRVDAQEEFGNPGNREWRVQNATEVELNGFALYWELWSRDRYQIYIDDQLVKDDANPYSPIIPFIHVPNIRAGGEFYGYADAETAFLIQDELNRKLADEGDTINNYAHPITIINKYVGDTKQLPVGPDQVWDLGREGDAHYLQWEGPAPATHDYIELLMSMMLDTSSMSQVAFGRHQGSQQSAIALAIEMMPVTERARWKRMLWDNALKQLVRVSFQIEELNSIRHDFTYEDLLTYDIDIVWAPMLPRDRLALVNEQVALFVNHLSSLNHSLGELGTPNIKAEREEIVKDIEEFVKLGVKMQLLGQASGSSSLPEGVSSASAKGRPSTK